MKILFDYKIFYQQRYGGISNYFYQLSKEFIKREIDLKITSQVHKNEYLKKIPKSFLAGNFFTFLPHKLNFIIENFNHFNARLFIKKFKPSIVHETYYSKKKYYSNLKTVCTAYDMINEINSIQVLGEEKNQFSIIPISSKTGEGFINLKENIEIFFKNKKAVNKNKHKHWIIKKFKKIFGKEIFLTMKNKEKLYKYNFSKIKEYQNQFIEDLKEFLKTKNF